MVDDEFDIWLDHLLSKTTSEGKVVASEEEALRNLLEIERIVRKKVTAPFD